MRTLSKSKIISYRQCHKKLWLDVHKRELGDESAGTQANYAVGNRVGELATQVYDQHGDGTLIDPFKDGFDVAIQQTQILLQLDKPIFEATFSINGGLVMADVMLPVSVDSHKDKDSGNKNSWRMIEVKSSTRVKDYHLDDIAVQSYVVQQAGINLERVALACIDNQWTYPGDGDYSGLLKEIDLSDHAFAMTAEVESWFQHAHHIVNDSEPTIDTGEHCSEPFNCQFLNYCQSNKGEQMTAQYPITWIPRIQTKKLKQYISDHNVADMQDVPDDLLNEKQLRVKISTLADEPYFNHAATAKELSQYQQPAYFLDFETINLAVPIWAGTKPYQQIPFQFSLHTLSHVLNQKNEITHQEFLDLTGNDLSRPFAEKLIELCGLAPKTTKYDAPIYVYNRGFESARIKELAERFPSLSTELLAINQRLVDLWPIAKNHYYHPSQQGSWSIKKLLPAIAPDLNYADLDGVQDGGMAMDAYTEAVSEETTDERKQEIKKQLLKYCELDTLAMVRIWEFFIT